MVKNYELPLSNPGAGVGGGRGLKLPGKRNLLKLLILASAAAGAFVLFSSFGGNKRAVNAEGGYVDVRYDTEYEKAHHTVKAKTPAKPWRDDKAEQAEERQPDVGELDAAKGDDVDEDEEAAGDEKPDFKVSHQPGTPRLTLQESMDLLHPLMREAKEKFAHLVPQEHDFTAPIFPPFLTDWQAQRYEHLKGDDGVEPIPDEDEPEVPPNRELPKRKTIGPKPRYMLVALCRQVSGMLGDWFHAWTVLAEFLGPETLSFSLIEGGSEDGAGEVLRHAFRKHLESIGVPPENIHIVTHRPAPDWEKVHRIEELAKMRNDAMAPLYASIKRNKRALAPDGEPYTAVVYYNDVYLSALHYLEILHQHVMKNSDMTCGWDHAGAALYDGWTSRTIESGDLFSPFPVPEEDRDKPFKMFPTAYRSKVRYDSRLPLQAFTAWNGIVAVDPVVFEDPYNVRFRRGSPERDSTGFQECQASESSLLPWDMRINGYYKLLVVPGVHCTYGKGDATVRGWLEYPDEEKEKNDNFVWTKTPPPKVRCHDWPDKPGKGWWAWDHVRWVDPPKVLRERRQ